MILEEIVRFTGSYPEDHFHAAARACGFELSGIAPATPSEDFPFYRQWISDGFAGPMGYLADHRGDLRADPRHLLPSARSVLCVGKLYKTKDIKADDDSGRISSYAWGAADYHDLMRSRMEDLVTRLQSVWPPFEARICVDTAPLLERSYARAAGLGWIGKNTCLINQPQGSWFFLGEILVSLDLAPGTPPPDRCGTCTRCIDACPTQALVPGPGGDGPAWRLDGRLCISTLTIETKGTIPEPQRSAMGHHLFGCDICQDVCPWNRRATESDEPGFQPVNAAPGLDEIAAMTPDEFRERFRRTPLWRTKWQGLVRNCAIVMGNTGDPRYRVALERLAACGDAVVEEHAQWALRQLG